MNSDPPSLGELTRRLNEMHDAMQRLVSQELYNAERRASDRRITEVERDLDMLRLRLDDALKTMAGRLEFHERERGSTWRQSVFAGVIPTALLLISLLVQIWISVQGNR